MQDLRPSKIITLLFGLCIRGVQLDSQILQYRYFINYSCLLHNFIVKGVESIMLAIRVKALRRSRGLNQVQLAEKLGVKKQSISNWENDNIMPSIDMLIKIADFFHVSTDYLLGRDIQNAGAPQMLDITGLTPHQIEHIQCIVDDLRQSEH